MDNSKLFFVLAIVLIFISVGGVSAEGMDVSDSGVSSYSTNLAISDDSGVSDNSSFSVDTSSSGMSFSSYSANGVSSSKDDINAYSSIGGEIVYPLLI